MVTGLAGTRIRRRAASSAPGWGSLARRRIGGIVGPEPHAAAVELAGALGEGARILLARPDERAEVLVAGRLPHESPGRPEGALQVVADCDACWWGGAPLDDEGWWRVAEREALCDVLGAFAVAWYRDGTLVLARDAVGERSLFYAEVPGGLVFASTLAAVLASGLVPRSIDRGGLAAYLSFAYVPGRRTMVEGVHELLPGEVVRCAGGRVQHGRFWTVPAERSSVPPPDARELRSRLDEAVRRRLPAPGTVLGASLSGGVDSSLVVALAHRFHEGPLRTYSICFGRRYPDELAFSSLVARHCRTAHRVVTFGPKMVIRNLDRTMGMLSNPVGDPLTVPNALLFEQAAGETSVLLNGEGGDPLFGGPKNLPMVLAELYGAEGAEPRLGRARSYLSAHRKCYEDLAAVLPDDNRTAGIVEALEHDLGGHLADPRWPSLVNRLMAINLTFKGAHHILSKVEHLSAPFHILPRSPLFDRHVVEAAFATPPQLKLRGSVEKWILKQAVADVVPHEVIERPKSGMRVPVEGWFRGPLLHSARERLLDGLAPHDFVRRDYLMRLVDPSAPMPRRGVKIWLLVSLEAWVRTVLTAPPRVEGRRQASPALCIH